ncbi:MAG TPA: MliC family protein [Candidatus Paceibacterota bacterium]|nr:MliC family protein [Candidatus Paceibacterota bacterium]
MNNGNSRGFWTILIIVAFVVLVGAIIYALTGTNSTEPAQNNTSGSSGTQNIEAIFTCDGGKSISATFMQGTSEPPTTPGGPPTPGGSVHLVLSDGRDMTLPQTISADGARYANANESFVFWNKGNGAFIQEGNSNTYNNCVTSAQ